jgi:OOP family OmpA-OmpF porin
MNHLSLFVFLLILLLPFPLLFGQNTPEENLVPNPSFEEFSDEPSGWYYSGRDFARVAMYWTSPTAASPDIYTPKVKVPPSWSAVGFGDQRPYRGEAFVGITVYGCGKGKPHCREYVQVLLTEALVPGQKYSFSCMLSHLPKSVSVKNIGLWFNDYDIDEGAHNTLYKEPVLLLNRFIPSDKKWYKWSGTFIAEKASSYLLIGNFSSDEDSQIKLPARSELRFGYYYLDDVTLYKIPPIIIPAYIESPLDNFHPEPGEIVTLSRIYFEHDRVDFMPRALIQLDQLLAFLNKYPNMKIEIIGHTDNVGYDAYNQQLSVRRSAAVVNWLVNNGIARDRLQSSGFGSDQPISTNYTSKGRSMNRRVEIKVLSL